MQTNVSGWDFVPHELKRQNHWVVWKYEDRTDKSGEIKPTKVPYTPLISAAMSRASSTDPATWGSFAEALGAFSMGKDRYDGLGFVVKAEGDIVGVDLDHCYDPKTATFTAWESGAEGLPSAEQIVTMLNSYTEITPSGTGLRVFMFGDLPVGRRRVKDIEMYNRGRFLTVTGNHLDGSPRGLERRTDELAALHSTLFGIGVKKGKQEAGQSSSGETVADELSDDDIIRMAGRASNGSKFLALWGGSTAGYATPSEADQALCSILAFWTQDFDHLERLMHRSGLAREKWTSRPDYRVSTINKALTGLKNTFGGIKENQGSNDDGEAGSDISDGATIRTLIDSPLSDAGNAECMVELYRDMFRYDHIRKKWLVWDGMRWQLDEDGEAERAALDVVRERRRAQEHIKSDDLRRKFRTFVINSENDAKRKAMLKTGSVLGTFATTINQYDSDNWLAATPNGTLDLHTGELREAQRADMLTMRLGTRHDAKARPQRWLTFLSEVFGGDQQLIEYVQRAVGYSLTGSTREQKMFLLFGEGMNGKSKFLSVLTALLGDYAGNAAFSTFDGDRRSEATNDLANLKGKRLVTVIETNEDRRLDESRVKAVTGEDQITCRFLYCEPFTYVPTYKLWMAVNHKPILKGTDRGIWRRIQVVPFLQSFQGIEDKNLEAKLLAELPGILNWALEGLQSWKEGGLGTAEAVQSATDEYKKESDLVGQWFEDCCASSPPSFISAADAYISFRGWCKGYGYREPTQHTFGRNMESKGYKKGKNKGQRGYFGFILLVGGSQD